MRTASFKSGFNCPSATTPCLQGIIRSFMSMRPGIEMASLSDLGCVRENNEDSYSYWEPASDAEFAQKGRLAVVADGMGGHEGGQEASRLAVEAIQETYADGLVTDPQALLTAGFLEAHQRIQSYAITHTKLRGMGTTATAAVLVADRLYYAHVGDSRLYRVNKEEITRLTHDHSYVGRLVENGVITPEEAEAHPQRNILTAALGAGAEIVVEAPAVASRPEIGRQSGAVYGWLVGATQRSGTASGRDAECACHRLSRSDQPGSGTRRTGQHYRASAAGDVIWALGVVFSPWTCIPVCKVMQKRLKDARM